jgi:Leishmanolysin
MTVGLIFDSLSTFISRTHTGIGTLWSDRGVIGTDSQCPYVGAKANAEFEDISGCSVVPTETDFGPGTKCGHWDEDCMGSELMTGFLDSGRNPISRITIATLDDLGYAVDYTKADSYTINDLNSNCQCRRRRTLLDMYHGETHQLGLRLPGAQRRKLSDEAYNTAVVYGKSILAENAIGSLFKKGGAMDVNSEVNYVADQVVAVFVKENDAFFDVVVRAGN